MNMRNVGNEQNFRRFYEEEYPLSTKVVTSKKDLESYNKKQFRNVGNNPYYGKSGTRNFSNDPDLMGLLKSNINQTMDTSDITGRINTIKENTGKSALLSQEFSPFQQQREIPTAEQRVTYSTPIGNILDLSNSIIEKQRRFGAIDAITPLVSEEESLTITRNLNDNISALNTQMSTINRTLRVSTKTFKGTSGGLYTIDVVNGTVNRKAKSSIDEEDVNLNSLRKSKRNTNFKTPTGRKNLNKTPMTNTYYSQGTIGK